MVPCDLEIALVIDDSALTVHIAAVVDAAELFVMETYDAVDEV